MERRRFFAAMAAGALLPACHRAAPQAEAPREPRLVSTSPSMTEIVFAVGRGALLVGRSSYCDHPPEALSIEAVGGFADPSLERIVALRPTLVTGERGPAGPELPSRLEALGIATYFPLIDRVADIATTIDELGAKIDASPEAFAVSADLRARFERLQARVAGRPRPRIVFLFDYKPLIAAGPASFPDDVLTYAGCENAVKSGTKYPRLGAEGLLALDPDFIIDGSAGAYAETPLELMRSITGLGDLRALRDNHLQRLEGTAALRPGPRIADGIEQIAKVAHASAFSP